MNYKIHKLTKPSEANAQMLSRISKASKAHWGYPAEWLALWQEDLEVTPAYLAQHHTFVLREVQQEAFIGFCIISEAMPRLWIEHLWVLPQFIGKGLGSALLETALSSCIQPEHQSVKVIADPNAAAFYEAKGFITVDYHPSQPGDRKLPIMERVLHSS